MSDWRIQTFTSGLRKRPIDSAIEILLMALLAFMPFAFGAVNAWSELIVLISCGALLGLLGIKLLLGRRAHAVWSWAYIPITLFLLVVVMQLIPLPAGLVSLVSPNTVKLKTQLLSDLPNASDLLSRITLSFYPNATQHDLRLLLASSIVFFVVLNTIRSAEQIQRMLWAIVVIGLLVALLALAQDFTDAKHIYWIGPAGRGIANAGPFVHYSHFGQYMNLCIGAALGLFLLSLRNLLRHRRFRWSVLVELWREGRLRIPCFLMVFVVLAAIAIFLCGSRSANIGMGAAFVFAVWSLSRVRRLPGRGWVLLPIGLIVLGVLLFVGFDGLMQRFARLESREGYIDRLQILKDLTVEWKQYPAFGMGMGTHRWVYPMFDRSSNFAIASHAENEYAQLMEETGLAGIVLLVAFVLIVGRSYFRAIHLAEPSIRIVGIGLGFGIMSVMAHSISDFGAHIPANALLCAVYFGLIVRLSRFKKSHRHQGSETLVPKRSWYAGRAVQGLGWVGAAGLCGWAIVSLFYIERGERQWKEVLVWEKALNAVQWNGTDQQYASILIPAGDAVQSDPGNVEYRLFLNSYRWNAIARDRDENGNVVLDDQGRQFTKQVVDELDEARVVCPTYGQVYRLAGQLRRNILDDKTGLHLIRLAYLLDTHDADSCFETAREQALSGDSQTAYRNFERYLTIGGSYADVVKFYADECKNPDLAFSLAQGSLARLSTFADLLEKSDPESPLVAKARTQAYELLVAESSKPDASPEVLLAMAQERLKRQDQKGAIQFYYRALAVDYTRVDTRMQLAKLLAEQGEVKEAVRQARSCVRMRPDSAEAKQLLGNLSVLPAAQALN